VEEHIEKKHKGEKEERGGGGKGEGGVAGVPIADAVVDTDLVSPSSCEAASVCGASNVRHKSARAVNPNLIFNCLHCFPTKSLVAFNSLHVCQLSLLLITVDQLGGVRIIRVPTSRVIDAVT